MRKKLESKREVLKVLEVNKTQVVRSFDFYKYVGLKRCNYKRWMLNTALVIGERGVDYFPTPDNVECKGMRLRLRYYFSVDFANSLCHVVRTQQAMQLKEHLKQTN